MLAALDQEGLMGWMLKLGADWRSLTAPGRDMQLRQPRSDSTHAILPCLRETTRGGHNEKAPAYNLGRFGQYLESASIVVIS